LIWLAGREGVQGAVVEALFSAYFHDGRDAGDRTVLIDGRLGWTRSCNDLDHARLEAG
jgi:hypothetical protein